MLFYLQLSSAPRPWYIPQQPNNLHDQIKQNRSDKVRLSSTEKEIVNPILTKS